MEASALTLLVLGCGMRDGVLYYVLIFEYPYLLHSVKYSNVNHAKRLWYL